MKSEKNKNSKKYLKKLQRTKSNYLTGKLFKVIGLYLKLIAQSNIPI